MARKNGQNWYIGAMTDWSERTFDVPLDFLDKKNYKIEILRDGVNANKRGVDYIIVTKKITSSDSIHISMKQGGGWAAILTPME
jgi:alpha-glucosidase